MNQFENLSVKFNKKNLTLAEIDKRAKELGLNRSQFVTLALKTLIDFDKSTWSLIERDSKAFGVAPVVVIQNLLIDRFMKDAAEEAVFGKRRNLDEFVFFRTPDGPALLTGSEFAEIKYEHYTGQFEAELFKKAIAKQKAGRQLTDREAAIIKKFKSLEGYPGEYEDRIEEELNED